MNRKIKKLIAGAMALALCLLSGCTGLPDNREDPLSGYDVNALLPFPTRRPEAAATATPTPAPTSTSIITLPQNWQNDSSVGGDTGVKQTVAPAPTYVRLEQGDTGEDVVRLQQRLIELGYLSGTADGNFGAKTKNAVKLFQKALGLSQTGVATISLQEKLFRSTAPIYVPTTIATNAPDGSQNVVTGYQALVRGDKGNDVLKLQRRLIELGYLTGTADGNFGAKTENAVKAFQAQLGLSQTGVASTAVQTYLYSSSAPYAPVQATATPTIQPTVRPTATPADDFGYRQLEPGDTGEDVIRMQNRLKQLGYFTANVTGNYYKETTAAVQRFQAELGLSQTGIATSALLTRLYASNAPAYSGATAEPTQEAGGYTTLRYGSKGTEVRNLQKRLIELGYMTTAADGDYGTRTVNAVKLFQQAIGYEQNGVASVGLQNLLFSDNAPVYVPVYTSAPTSVPTSVPSAGYQQLQPGHSGDAVKKLQTRLKELGFFSGVIGGNYLTKTTDAVRLFQAAIGHAQTGVATPEMQEILYSDSAPDYASTESAYVDLEKNDSGIQVQYMQQRLIELGYLTGTADGDFGAKTETAVKLFQQQVGMSPTGKATAQMQQYLFSPNAPYAPLPTQAPTQQPTQRPTQRPTSVPQQPENDYRELKYGVSGQDVKNLQSRLTELGYYEGELGGNYRSLTTAAVQLFQAAIGYPTDGVATIALQTLLFSSSAPRYDGRSYIALQSGDEGPAVRNLQRRLIELGYLTGTADGDFGAGTEKAVKNFQQAVGYTRDGIASVELQMILFSSDAPANQPQATAVPPVVTNPPVVEEDDSPRDLSFGDTGAQVKQLQLRLKELGYLTGTADGDYGSGTRNAVKLFQQVINYYTTDGVATIELQQLIYASDAPVYVEEEDDESGYRTLVHGDSGEDVKAIQRRLKELGYFDGNIGGNYLTKTETAVKLFQAAVGYPTDGVCTPALQELLFSSNAPAYSDTPSVPAPTTPPVSPEKPDHLEVLSHGDSGSLVRTLQQRLIYLGWLIGEADGDFGGATETALNAFLYRMGLPVDGIASIEAQELLYMETAPAYVEYFDLLPGEEGEEILAMQMRLIELGYLENNRYNTDGIYGTGLQNALISLQLASGVEPELADGLATIELQTFLFSENSMLYAILPFNM